MWSELLFIPSSSLLKAGLGLMLLSEKKPTLSHVSGNEPLSCRGFGHGGLLTDSSFFINRLSTKCSHWNFAPGILTSLLVITFCNPPNLL